VITPALGINLKDYHNTILKNKIWRMSEKIDGVRRLFIKDTIGKVKCYSRSGKEDIWLTHIVSFLESPWFPHNKVYDCELVDRQMYIDNKDSFLLRTETIAKSSKQSYEGKEDLIAICFDIFTPGSTDDGRTRDQLLDELFDHDFANPVLKVNTYGVLEGDDIDMLDSVLEIIKDKNGEGLMLMDLDAMYVPGRSKALIKVKKLDEYVGRIIDYELAKNGTKIEGGIAALICEVDGCTVPVRVGTGFTDEQRRELLRLEGGILGLDIEIEAFSYTKDKKGDISLSFPVFKGFLKNESNEDLLQECAENDIYYTLSIIYD